MKIYNTLKTKKWLEFSNIFIYIPIWVTLFASVLLSIVTTIKISKETMALFYYGIDLTKFSVAIISSLDSYLLAIILYIFSLSLYWLFIGGLEVPKWLEVHSLDDLKKKLSSVIALILAVLFLKHIVEWDNGKETLYFAISIALMIGALIAYMISKENFKLK